MWHSLTCRSAYSIPFRCGDVSGISGDGGAIQARVSSTLILEGSTVSGNKAEDGGGIALEGECTSLVRFNLVWKNKVKTRRKRGPSQFMILEK